MHKSLKEAIQTIADWERKISQSTHQRARIHGLKIMSFLGVVFFIVPDGAYVTFEGPYPETPHPSSR
jgi:hypothetical protein